MKNGSKDRCVTITPQGKLSAEGSREWRIRKGLVRQPVAAIADCGLWIDGGHRVGPPGRTIRQIRS